MHLEEKCDKLDIELDKILTPEKDDEDSNQTDESTNPNNDILHQAQNYKNNQDEDDIEGVIIEGIHLDDIVISGSSEEEISKYEKTFPKVLHSS